MGSGDDYRLSMPNDPTSSGGIIRAYQEIHSQPASLNSWSAHSHISTEASGSSTCPNRRTPLASPPSFLVADSVQFLAAHSLC